MNTDQIDKLLKRPIAYHKVFAKIAGSVTAGLFLSQAWYWKDKADDDQGWFWKTEAQWEEETALTRYEQETARKALKAKGYIEEDKRGMPAKLYFRIRKEAVLLAVLEYVTGCGKPADKDAEKQQA